MDEMPIRINYVDTIQPGENGQARLVVSKPGRVAGLPLTPVGD